MSAKTKSPRRVERGRQVTRWLWRRFGYDARDLFWMAVLVLLFLACAIQPRCAHAAEPVAVTPALVCSVQHAIRWKDAAWTDQQCAARAREFTASGKRWGFKPAQLFAMAINESDLRTEARRIDRDRSPAYIGRDGSLIDHRTVRIADRPVLAAHCNPRPQG